MVNYSPHDSGKDANREDIISYGATPLLVQDRPVFRYPDTPQPTYGSPSTVITDHSLQRQPSHYDTHEYRLSPIQGSRKRRRIDNEPEASEGTDHNYGYRPILQNLPLPMDDPSAPSGGSTDLTYADHVGASSSRQSSNQDYLQNSLPQQHHHHRLPPQALAATGQGSETTGSYLPQVDRSHLTGPGMPKPFPAPKAPKTRFGPGEDALLIKVKEELQLSWNDIAFFFPGRKKETLQVRYCTKLRERVVVWDDDLDQKLKAALREYEYNKWTHISRKLGPGVQPATCQRRAEELG
ncbi:hypothetical protein N7447_000742 [Penicillium robsamsonii]|uniref:uncharacterized protein n=1 Tax=Penicillium robsamsonii TaxID=1792511 RepID=UPI002546E540|nr:uncharacterized protein N7447_000742 [Penicillium robsamsonii]KAJ5834716.1 hypothetical protein N7447_000742 [Penicillium robsamsonii]